MLKRRLIMGKLSLAIMCTSAARYLYQNKFLNMKHIWQNFSKWFQKRSSKYLSNHSANHFSYLFLILKDTNIKKLYNSVVEKTASICPTLVPEARELSERFKKAFQLFANCHNIYDSAKYLPDETINNLGIKRKISYCYLDIIVLSNELKSINSHCTCMFQRKTMTSSWPIS